MSRFVLLYTARIMPRAGALVLSEVRVPVPVCRLRTLRTARAVRRGEAHVAIQWGREGARNQRALGDLTDRRGLNRSRFRPKKRLERGTLSVLPASPVHAAAAVSRRDAR